MSADIANLGIVVKSTGIGESIQGLDRLEKQVVKTEAAIEKFSNTASIAFRNAGKAAKDLQAALNFSGNVGSGITGISKTIVQAQTQMSTVRIKPPTIEKDVEETLNLFQRMGQGFSDLRTLLGGGLMAGGLMNLSSGVIKMADSWLMMEARLKQATGSTEDAVSSQKKLIDVATELHVPLEGVTQLYTRMVPAIKAYGYNMQDALEVTKAVAMALKLNGSTGAEASSVMLQFSQSMAAGRLNGAEFNAVAEGAAPILRALSAETGKTRAELKKMGADGTLDIDLIVTALKKVGPQWESMVKQLPLTWDGAMTDIKSRFLEAIGEINKNSGFTTSLAKGLKVIADNASLVVNVIGGSLIVLMSTLAGKIVASTAATVADTIARQISLKAMQAETATLIANTTARIAFIRANYAAGPAQAALAVQTNILTTAQALQATTAARLVTVSGTLRAALAFLGGPIGVITMLLTAGAAAWMMWGKKAEDEIQKTREHLAQLRVEQQEFQKMKSGIAPEDGKVKETRLMYESELKRVQDLKAQIKAKSARPGGLSKGTAEYEQYKRDLGAAVNRMMELKKGLDYRRKEVADSLSASNSTGVASDFLDNSPTGRYLKAKKKLEEEYKKSMKTLSGGTFPQGSKEEIERTASYKEQLVELEKLNPAVKEKTKEDKEARKAAAEAAKALRLHNKEITDAVNAETHYARAMAQVTDFEDKQNKLQLEHAATLGDMRVKAEEEVNLIKDKTASLELQRKGIKLTEAQEIASSVRKQQALLDEGVIQQKRLQQESAARDIYIEDEYENIRLAKNMIEMIGEKSDVESQAALKRAQNSINAAQHEIEYQAAIDRSIEKQKVENEGLEKKIQALKDNTFQQAMLSMETSGRTLGQTLTDSFGNAGNALGQLADQYTEFAAKMSAIEADRKAAVEAGAKDPAKIAAANVAAADATMSAQMNAYANMSSAAKGFFKQHTAGYKVMATAEKAFRVIEMLMAAKSFALKFGLISAETTANATKTAASISGMTLEGAATWALAQVKAILGIANQAGGDPLTAFGRMAAMAAIMGGIGLATGAFGGGGGSGMSAAEKQANAGTGSVFGDNKAKSESISKSLEIVAENSKISATYNRGMLTSLRNIEASMSGLTNILVRGGITTTKYTESNGKPQQYAEKVLGNDFLTGFLSKRIGGLVGSIFGGKQSVEDYGVMLGAKSIKQIEEDGLRGKQYTDIKKKGGWFSSDKYSRRVSGLSSEVENQFSMVVIGMKDSIANAAKILNLNTTGFKKRLDKFVVDIGDISFKDLSSEEIQKQFNNIFSKVGDDMAKYAIPSLEKYTKVGEGYFETLIRVASQIATVDGLFLSMGIDVSDSFGTIASVAIDAKMQLIEFAGGIEEFGNKVSDYYDKYYTDAEKSQLTINDVQAKLAAMGQTVQLGYTESENLAAFRKVVEAQDLSTVEGRRAYAALLEIAPSFASIAKTFVDKGQTGAFGAAGNMVGISPAVMDAADLWWTSYGGENATDNQTVIAQGITSINNNGTKESTLKALATSMGAQVSTSNEMPSAIANNISSQMQASEKAKTEQMQQVIVELQKSNAMLKAELSDLKKTVAEGSRSTVGAIQDTASNNNVLR